MEYRNLVTFLRVAELQNFTKAANELGYAQSTVTFHIQSLEEELGVTLFDRIGKKVSLTSAGEYLVNYANEMMKILTDIRQLNESVDVMSGKLRVGVVESVLATYMPDAVLRYNEKFPNVEIEIMSHTTSTLLEMLRSNDLDIAVVMGKRIVDPDFRRPLIKLADISFVTGRNNPIASKNNLTFKDIAEEKLVLPEKQSLYRRAVENAAADFDCVLVPKVQVNNTAIIVRLLKMGMGVSYLPNYLIRPDLDSGDLVALNLENDVRQEYYIQVLYHMKKWLTPQMKEFVGLMEELLQGEKDA
ncbi:MAG: LysR family transcriptional regulator [Clostridium sp.]|nr:LysR family transcriptional regulator [Clostridium sp.]